MRAVAALSVVFYHVAFKFPPPRSQVGQYLSQRNAGPPVTAVVLFFVISGFVLYLPFVRARYEGEPMPALVPYAVRRLARIVPAYWVALAIVSVWLGLGYVLTPGGLLRYFGFLQVYGKNSTAGGGISVAWTLCVEVSFYAVLPLLALGVRRLGRGRSIFGSELALCAVLVLISLTWQLVITTTIPSSNTWVLPMLSVLTGSLDFFAAGMLLAILSVESSRRRAQPRWVAVVDRRPWLPWLLALAILYAEGRVPGRLGPTGWWMSTHALKLAGAALLLVPVIFGTPGRGWLRRALGWPPLLWLGTVSYGIYLWHDPLLTKLAPQLVSHGELVTTLVVSAVTIAVAAVSFYLIERPAQRLARGLLRARAGRRAPVAALGTLISGGAAAPTDPGA
jgi:peptidoglycan/LPS O-acetylase OafA/YrhL